MCLGVEGRRRRSREEGGRENSFIVGQDRSSRIEEGCSSFE